MTIWISRELPLLNFERLDILCAWIGPLSEKLWPFQFLECFRFSISRVSIYYAPKSDFVWKVMTICISRDLTWFNFGQLHMWCAWIGHPNEKLWPYEILESFRCLISSVSISEVPESYIRVKSYDNFNFSRASIDQFRASRYVMRLNRTSDWIVRTSSIFRELPMINFERLDILCAWIGLPCEKLYPFEFLRSFRCSISSVSICDVPKSNIWVKSYDHLNFSKLSLFSLQRLDMWCAWIRHPSEKLWPFKFL